MSDENKIPNEEELWNLISEPVAESKAEKPLKRPKAEGKFAQPRPVKTAATDPSPRKIDGFFLTCMAGVAAVSVAATLMLVGIFGGEGSSAPKNPEIGNPVAGETISEAATALERENAELRALLEQQKQQIKDLQTDLLKLIGSEEYLSTVPSNPEDSNAVIDAQVEAYEIFSQVQDAYADFDRERLDALIPQMDALLSYLDKDTLGRYYQILEYLEQPSNG